MDSQYICYGDGVGFRWINATTDEEAKEKMAGLAIFNTGSKQTLFKKIAAVTDVPEPNPPTKLNWDDMEVDEG